MRFSSSDFEAALRQKRSAAGETSRPAKKARRRGPADPTPGVNESAAPAAERVGEPAVEAPPAEAAPAPAIAGVEEGEIVATAEAAVVVVDLEEESPVAAEVPEAERVMVAAPAPSAATEREVVKKPPPTGREPSPGRPAKGGGKSREKRRTPDRPPRDLPEQLVPPQRQVEGAHERVGRPGPRPNSMSDAVEAAVLVAQLSTPDSAEEVRRMSAGALLDMQMVAMVQMANGALGLRDVLARNSSLVTRTRDRAERYRKESEVLSRDLSRLQTDFQAREDVLKKRAEEAEKRAGEEAKRAEEAANRASSSEAKLNLIEIRYKTHQVRAEEQDRHLHQTREELEAARNEARAATEKAAAAERAVAEARSEKAGAVAYADEAGARAEEAENRSLEAEARAKEAEAKAQQAVDDYKSSEDLKKEIIEASLDAYVKGFESCRAKMAGVFKIDSAEAEKIQPGESVEEEADEEDDEGGEPPHP